MGLSRTAVGLPVPSAAQRARLRAVDHDPVLAWVGTVAVTLLAGFLSLWHLGQPQSFLFDETYYAKDAWSLLHFGYAQNYVDQANQEILAGHTTGLWTGAPEMVVHPEVGKWIIAIGEHLFGMTPFGWRISSAVVGTLMVMVMIRLARRVTRSTMLGLVAGLLMTFDGLHYTLSRLALLDIYVAFFVLCAVSCMVADRDWSRERLARQVPPGTRLAPGAWGPLLLWRPWRLATGVFWGLALGTKWDALFPLAVFGLLMWFWDAGARRSFGVRYAIWKAALLDAAPALVYVVLLPFLIYLVSWTGWLMHASVFEQAFNDTQYGPYWGSYIKQPAHGFFPELVKSLRSLYHYHRDVYSFHTGFLNHSTHPYQSDPWGWLVLNRPVNVDTQSPIQPGQQGCTAAAGSTCLRQVLMLGNPVVWWFGTCAVGVVGHCLGRQARLALRADHARRALHLAAVAALRQPPDLQLLRDRDAAVHHPGHRDAAGRAGRAGARHALTSRYGLDRRGSRGRARDRELRLLLADPERPGDQQRAVGAPHVVQELDLRTPEGLFRRRRAGARGCPGRRRTRSA